MAGRFLVRRLPLRGRAHAHRVWLPPGWSPDRRPPVVLFLHGAGERGTDGRKPIGVGLGPALRRDPERWPVVAFPQCLPGRLWVEPEMAELALGVLDRAEEEFGEPGRPALLTGVSMGGYGCWALARHAPSRFAAVVPVCGGWPWRGRGMSADAYVEAVTRVSALPAWVFHGVDDPVIPVSESRRVVEDLRAMGADVRSTEYPGVGHDSWDPAYAEPELPGWLLSHVPAMPLARGGRAT